jgi:hypothetical protein
MSEKQAMEPVKAVPLRDPTRAEIDALERTLRSVIEARKAKHRQLLSQISGRSPSATG